MGLTLLHLPTGGANDTQNVSVDTARGKDVEFLKTSRIYKNHVILQGI